MQRNKLYVDLMALHSEVTGSCNFNVAKFGAEGSLRYIVDCGLFQEREYDYLNKSFPFDASLLNFGVITHNHVDHTGRMPLLAKQGFNGKFYMTETTSKLVPLALEDSHKVLRDVAKRKHVQPLYEETDVFKALSMIRGCKYNEPIQVLPNIKITFLQNGHLMGAASVLLQISYDGQDINWLFAGDYNNKNMFFDVPQIPQYIRDMPLNIVQEATYGDMDSTEIEPCFEKNIIECVKNGGTVIVPVFSLGRSQEILYVLKKLQMEGILDVNIPIYFDGKLAIRYTMLYVNDGLDIKPEMRDFLPKNLTYVDKTNRSQILNDTNVKIILSTSGMGSYGPAQVYIPEYITRKNALIHFTGYCAEGTLGYKLKNANLGEMVEMSGMVLKKRAQVEFTTEYSAHAKADEMIAFLKQFNQPKLILINHGEENVKRIFAERVAEEVELAKRVGILSRDYFFSVNQYGLEKTLSTKFE